MSVKPRDDKPSTSSALVGCCQSSNTTPENSIADYCIEEIEAPNNNTLFHVTGDDSNAIESTHDTNEMIIDVNTTRTASVDFKFPKRPKVDIEFQNIKYTVKQFSFKQRQFGKHSFFPLFLFFILNHQTKNAFKTIALDKVDC